MSTATNQPNEELLSENPGKQAREWFVLGVRKLRVVARLVDEYGLEEGAAELCFKGMMEELEADFAAAVETAEQEAAGFYREIKHDPGAPWGARLKAQIDLERLLQLVARSGEPGGRNDPEVLEAFGFHEKLIADAKPTPHQKLRANSRRLLLLGVQPQPERRGGRTSFSSSPPGRSPMPGRIPHDSAVTDLPAPILHSTGR